MNVVGADTDATYIAYVVDEYSMFMLRIILTARYECFFGDIREYLFMYSRVIILRQV